LVDSSNFFIKALITRRAKTSSARFCFDFAITEHKKRKLEIEKNKKKKKKKKQRRGKVYNVQETKCPKYPKFPKSS
jgi:hypothetical protein